MREQDIQKRRFPASTFKQQTWAVQPSHVPRYLPETYNAETTKRPRITQTSTWFIIRIVLSTGKFQERYRINSKRYLLCHKDGLNHTLVKSSVAKIQNRFVCRRKKQDFVALPTIYKFRPIQKLSRSDQAATGERY